MADETLSDSTDSADTLQTSQDPAQLQAEIADLKDQVLRAYAEVENTRRRLERDKQDASKYAIANFARAMLEVADQLDLALNAVPAEERQKIPLLASMMTGVEATRRTMADALTRAGVTRIDPLGQRFDPHLHEVMFEVPGGTQPAGTVVQVLTPGYMLQDRLLRPARVGVAQGDPAAPPAHGLDQRV